MTRVMKVKRRGGQKDQRPIQLLFPFRCGGFSELFQPVQEIARQHSIRGALQGLFVQMKSPFLRESEQGTVGTRTKGVGSSIYMVSATSDKDNGHKSQPSSEPVSQTTDLI